MTIKKVILVGANGSLGPAILQALLDAGTFEVSVLTRASSKSTYSSPVSVLTVDDNLPHDQLVKAFAGQDALVIAVSGTQKANSIEMADAAFEASVTHIIPADYGSCDSSDPRSLDLIPLYVNKKDVRDHLTELTKKSRNDGSTISWTSLITGHFFDYGLRSGLLSMDVEKGTAVVFDDGEHRWAATMLSTIGLATTRILQNYQEPRLCNKLVFLQSVQTTQNRLIQTVEKVTGKHIEIERVNSDTFTKNNKSKLDKDPGNADVTEELVSVEGIVNTNFDSKGDAYVNDLLQLPGEDLEDLVRRSLR